MSAEFKQCPACRLEKNKVININIPSLDHKNILPKKYDLLKCNNCGLFYKMPFPSTEKLKLFYNSIGNASWNYSTQYPYELKIANLIEDAKFNDKILDVGCNAGRTLEKYVNKLDCYGVEPNEDAAEVARKKGIKVYANIHDEGIVKNAPYNYLLLLDVLEHITNPKEYLDRLIRMLDSKGSLIILTGTTDNILFRLVKGYHWYAQPAQHLTFINKSFLKWYEQQHGKVNIKFVKVNHFYFHFRNFMHQLVWHIIWKYTSVKSPYRKINLELINQNILPPQTSSFRDHLLITITLR